MSTMEAFGRTETRLPRNGRGESLAAALGVFGIALGAAELFAPRQVARLIGAADDEASRRILMAMGAREIGSGVGALSSPRPAGWIWSRVAGDALDLSLLAAAARRHGAEPRRLAAAALAVAGVAALDVACAAELSAAPSPQRRSRVGWTGPIHVVKAITVNRPADELYAFWRQIENLPRVTRHLLSVTALNDRRSHWRARAPLGRTVEWEAEITEDRPGERLAWRSAPGAQIANAGAVTFASAPGGRGTVLTVDLRYAPPGGALGAAVAKLLGEEPEVQLQEDLRRFKQVMETGEVVLSDGALASGRPARPPGSDELRRSRHDGLVRGAGRTT